MNDIKKQYNLFCPLNKLYLFKEQYNLLIHVIVLLDFNVVYLSSLTYFLTSYCFSNMSAGKMLSMKEILTGIQHIIADVISKDHDILTSIKTE